MLICLFSLCYKECSAVQQDSQENTDYIAHNRTVPLMRSMHQVLLKQKRPQVESEGGTVEIWVSQFI